MLELIARWVLGVTAAALAVAVADALCPEGSVRAVLRLTGGLVLLTAVLTPLLRLDTEALGRALTEYRLELDGAAARLEEENETLMRDIIEEQAAAYIQDKAAGLGISCRVAVEADGAGDWPVPTAVTVTGALTAEQREALTRTIEADFAVPAERQTYESGGGG